MGGMIHDRHARREQLGTRRRDHQILPFHRKKDLEHHTLYFFFSDLSLCDGSPVGRVPQKGLLTVVQVALKIKVEQRKLGDFLRMRIDTGILLVLVVAHT